MASPHRIADLEVVGYATVLKDTILPSPVAPIFRVKSDPARIVFPPYHFADGQVWNATESEPQELKSLADKGEITVFETALPASPGLDLWVDQEHQPHYEIRAKARETLRRIALDHIQKAREAFKQGQYEQANRYCGVALSADDRLVDALAIKAAICRARNDLHGERVMQKMAAPSISTDAFQQLMKGIVN
jgi:hypothetical protein